MPLKINLVRRSAISALLMPQIAPCSVGASVTRHIRCSRQILSIIKQIG
jgi:hypothetical protein